MAINILLHILIPVLFFISFQMNRAGLLFIPSYSLMLYFLSERMNGKRTFRSAFFIFGLFWLLMLNWLLTINVDLTLLQRVLIFFGWIFLSALMSLVWSVPYLFISVRGAEIFMLPVALSSLEYVLSASRDLSFLWVTPSTAVIDYPVFFQSADLGGSYLVSLIVVAFAVLLFRIFLKGRRPFDKISFALLLFLVVIYGSVRINEERTGEIMRVTVVQPDIPGEMKESYREFIDFRFASIKDNLETARQQDGELIVFPETASPVYLTKHSRNEIKSYLEEYSAQTGKYILIGGLTYDYGGKREEDRYYNSAFLISPGETVAAYNKIRCVPFVERLPYQEYMPFLKRIDYGQGGYSTGKEQTVFDIKGRRVSAYICFESIFPTYVSSFTRRGAQLLINISEDAWFTKGIGAVQHYKAGIMRSVENRRYLVRSSNPGISAVIDPCGRVVEATNLNESRVFTAEVMLLDRLTFFAASGNILPKIFLLITIAFAALKIIRRKNGKSETENSA